MSLIEETPANKALITRIKMILTKPVKEWEVIDAEPATAKGLYAGYACILAAISPICILLGGLGFGYNGFRPAILSGVVNAVIAYVLSLAMVFLLALVISALATTFNGQKNPIQALKVSVYASTAAWVAGVFNLIPALSPLAIIGGLYSLYLLYLGLPKLMKTPGDKALAYAGATILAAVVLSAVIGAIAPLDRLSGVGFVNLDR